jgi:exodeoxyribonuclease V beta subunit
MPGQGAPAFDVCGPLPQPGVTLLEASAGTGKTFALAALVSRFVADGIPLSRILAVTFTRTATSELRDRVRQRLASDEEALGRVVGGDNALGLDPVAATLAQGTTQAVSRRRQALADALATFDAATIATTHGFCHLALASLGVLAPVADGSLLCEDPDTVVGDAVDDIYAGRVLRCGPLGFDLAVARSVGVEAVRNPAIELRPDAGDQPAGLRRRFAERLQGEVERRLRDAHLLTFDQLLVKLAEAMHDGPRGADVCQTLKGRYDVVIVDEFQDTDHIQWEIVRRAFAGGGTTLVLIGDPKQAIYSFRGADVYAYLEASTAAQRRCTLGTNWRSDQRLIDGLDALFQPTRFGHAQIAYLPVQASDSHQAPGLRLAPSDAGMRVRLVQGTETGRRLSNGRLLKGDAERWVASDVAAQIVALLSSGAELRKAGGGWRPVCANDLAVLVRTNDQAVLIRESLTAASVPAAEAGTQSVFLSPSAPHWMRLLEALEQPSAPARAAALALTPWIGMTATEVAEAGEQTWDRLNSQLHRWADILRDQGVASLLRAITADRSLPPSLLGLTNGERRLTDAGHIGELLHAEATSGPREPAALRAWLSRRIDDAKGDQNEERSRRLDSDADAVQILTVHRAKGLEFPIVYVPFPWSPSPAPRTQEPVVYHDPETGNRTLDVGGPDGNPGWREHLDLARHEKRGEDLRNLYVALTRARHQVTLWWAYSRDTEKAALTRLLLWRSPDGNVDPDGKSSCRESQVEDRLRALAARSDGALSVEPCGRPDPAWRRAWTGARPVAGDLAVAGFDRRLDLTWRRTSYTAITAGRHGDLVGSEPEDTGVSDEPAAGEPIPVSADASDEAGLRAVPSPLALMPGGTAVGSAIHRAIEQIDFAAPDLGGEASRALAAASAGRLLSLGPPGQAAAGVVSALSTPLGPLMHEASLRDFARGDRVDEMGFELPLAGGEQPDGSVLTSDVARLFAEYSPPGAVLHGYAGRLQGGAVATRLRGYLTGSLDLVLRVRGADGSSRFVVIDYKTNRLAPEGESLTAWHYRPAALDAEMQRDHYPLQAALYLVALHRYLRWRVAGYHPGRHLGGVLYLFLRGMTGPGNPTVDGQPCGVFSWTPPAEFVTRLSHLLDTGRLA